MTRAKKTLIVTVSIITLVIAGTNLFLFYGLTDAVKQRLPGAIKSSGMNIDFSRISASIPGGTVQLHNLVVKKTGNGGTNTVNLVSMEKASINIGLLSLPRGIVNLSSIDITNARLTFSGVKKGRHLKEPDGSPPGPYQDEKTPGTTGTDTNRSPDDTGHRQPAGSTAATGQAVPKAVIGSARINTVVEYINPTNNAKLALDLKVTADNLRTFGDQEKDTGSFSVKGNLEGKPGSMVIDIKGSTAPFDVPGKPTFEINGTITNICTRDFQVMADNMGIEAGCIDFTINVKCDKGVFVTGRSDLRTRVTNFKLTSAAAGRARGMSIANLSLSIPLKGTVEKPEFDLIGALVNSFTGNIDTMIKSINVDQKNVDKKLDKFLDSILGGKKKKNDSK